MATDKTVWTGESVSLEFSNIVNTSNIMYYHRIYDSCKAGEHWYDSSTTSSSLNKSWDTAASGSQDFTTYGYIQYSNGNISNVSYTNGVTVHQAFNSISVPTWTFGSTDDTYKTIWSDSPTLTFPSYIGLDATYFPYNNTHEIWSDDKSVFSYVESGTDLLQTIQFNKLSDSDLGVNTKTYKLSLMSIENVSAKTTTPVRTKNMLVLNSVTGISNQTDYSLYNGNTTKYQKELSITPTTAYNTSIYLCDENKTAIEPEEDGDYTIIQNGCRVLLHNKKLYYYANNPTDRTITSTIKFYLASDQCYSTYYTPIITFTAKGIVPITGIEIQEGGTYTIEDCGIGSIYGSEVIDPTTSDEGVDGSSYVNLSTYNKKGLTITSTGGLTEDMEITIKVWASSSSVYNTITCKLINTQPITDFYLNTGQTASRVLPTMTEIATATITSGDDIVELGTTTTVQTVVDGVTVNYGNLTVTGLKEGDFSIDVVGTNGTTVTVQGTVSDIIYSVV